MPNKNYHIGRKFEYEVMNELKGPGCAVMRTAGSHGPFDVIAINKDGACGMIQCKVVETEAEADRLIRAFRERPPFPPASCEFVQRIEVKIKRKGRKSLSV